MADENDGRASVNGSAVFSPCGLYRYSLWRRWGSGPRVINFICLNPSTATETVDDPTVSRLIVRAQQYGFDTLVVTNVFAWRATDPKELLVLQRDGRDPSGPDNDQILLETAVAAEQVVCGWSGHRAARWRGPAVKSMLLNAGVTLYCLNLGEKGSPMHPLYRPYSEVPREWR